MELDFHPDIENTMRISEHKSTWANYLNSIDALKTYDQSAGLDVGYYQPIKADLSTRYNAIPWLIEFHKERIKFSYPPGPDDYKKYFVKRSATAWSHVEFCDQETYLEFLLSWA